MRYTHNIPFLLEQPQQPVHIVINQKHNNNNILNNSTSPILAMYCQQKHVKLRKNCFLKTELAVMSPQLKSFHNPLLHQRSLLDSAIRSHCPHPSYRNHPHHGHHHHHCRYHSCHGHGVVGFPRDDRCDYDVIVYGYFYYGFIYYRSRRP